jgi:hypothetical protein
MEFVIKKFSVNSGAMTWFKMFGAIVWNLLLLNNFFLNFLKKPRLKTILEFWGIIGIVGKPSPSLI